MKNLNFASVSILGVIFGTFATSAYSVVGTPYEPLMALWFVFALLSGVLTGIFVVYSDFGDILKFYNKQRFFALTIAVVSAITPYLLWVNEIVTFN